MQCCTSEGTYYQYNIIIMSSPPNRKSYLPLATAVAVCLIESKSFNRKIVASLLGPASTSFRFFETLFVRSTIMISSPPSKL